MPKYLRPSQVLPAVLGLAVTAIVAVPIVLHGGSAVADPAPVVEAANAVASAAAAPAVAAVLHQTMHTGVGSVVVPAGFPSAATTGVPIGTTLRVMNGNVTVSRAGSVIAGAEINGCVLVAADNVTIVNTKINCGGRKPAVYLPGAYTGTRISHVEVNGMGVATVGIEIKNAVVDSVNVYGSGDGIHLGRNATLVNSYIHDLGVQANLHHDCLQTLHGSSAVNISVVHNTLIAYTPRVADNSVYHLGTGSIANVLVASNFIDGGHYSVQVGNGANQHNIVFRGNTFGHHYHWAIASLGDPRGRAVSFVNNIWAGSGGTASPENSKGHGLGR